MSSQNHTCFPEKLLQRSRGVDDSLAKTQHHQLYSLVIKFFLNKIECHNYFLSLLLYTLTCFTSCFGMMLVHFSRSVMSDSL